MCSRRVGRSIRVVSGFWFQGSSVWLLVLVDGGRTAQSEFLELLQCQGRMCLLGLGGAPSRLATRSSSQGHGGELRLEIIYRQRDSPVLRNFSPFSKHLASEEPVDYSQGPSPLVVDRDDQVDSREHIVSVAESDHWYANCCRFLDRLPVRPRVRY